MHTRRLRSIRPRFQIVKTIPLSRYFGYGVSIVSLIVAAIFIFDISLPRSLPVRLRIMCGVVFLLMSVYRFVVTRYNISQEQRSER